ncbi:helix-turn-helix transcriptional regulator [Cryptosporangium sp. NPDC048952]|uniref:helix-turn-helix transcriptional regulator n=1 Tax=Cryptosporangium sp. NPDC048952 TaxID=3363961 RepID=UPI00371F62AA
MSIRLARKLRELRQTGLGRRLTQEQLGQLLGGSEPLSAPLISSWERERDPVVPPEERLRAYAHVFATKRSLTAGMLAEDDLVEAEKERLYELESELMGLRQDAISEPKADATRSVGAGSMIEEPPIGRAVGYGTWHFADQRPVVIVASELPAAQRPEYADPSSPDYVEMYQYADLDAMVEAYGHIRAANPQNTRVRFRSARTLTRDDFASHLVLLGGVDWNPVTRDILVRLDLPVRQVSAEDRAQDAYFEATDGDRKRQFRPTVIERSGETELIEDVALFYRGSSPLNRRRTVTICNAMYGRGTLGAVRALTDAWFRDRNEAYLAERFGDVDEFLLLVRVPVFAGNTVTPDWTLEENRLFEWPAQPSVTP